jgi:hypothetical protein
VPLLNRGPAQHAAPSTYTLAAGEAFEPESVTATFDGSGAAGSFLPVLSIYAQSGELISRSPAAQLAAGDSAEVTFAPLLRAAAAAAPAGAAFPWAQSGINGYYSVTSGVSTQFALDSGDIWGTGADSGLFTVDSDGLGQFGLGIHAPGTYASFWGVQFFDTAAAPVAAPANFNARADDGSGAMHVMLPNIGNIEVRGFTNHSGRAEWDLTWISTFAILSDTGATPEVLTAVQTTGVTLRVYTQLLVFQLSTDTFGF